MKLLAIDGNSIINRAFYGIKLLTTKSGEFTNGIYGFLNILHRLTELEQPDGVAIAFDLRHPTFRHQKYAEYKAGRKGMPPELASQMPILKEVLTAHGYICLEQPGYEADDILGTLARLTDQSGDQCVIATGDRDSLQLVSPTTRVLLAATKAGHPEIIDCTEEWVQNKYGVPPKALIEVKALQGDASDNIPGVAGVGEKTAGDLIARFGNIDYIYEHLTELDIKEGLRAKLAAGQESAFLSRELGTIFCQVPINENIQSYAVRPIDRPALLRLFQRLEFFKMIEKMGLADCGCAPAVTEKTAPLCVCCAPAELAEKCRALGKADLWFDGERFALSVGEAACTIAADAAELHQILADARIAKRVNDAKLLYRYTLQKGLAVENITFDSCLAGYILNPASNAYDLTRLAQEYGAPSAVLEDDADGPAARAALLSAVCDKLESEIAAIECNTLLKDIEIPLARALAKMELAGFMVDTEGIAAYGAELQVKIEELTASIYSQVGYEFNLNSPKQLGVALFEKMGLPCKKKTKSGYSTNAEVLEELRSVHPVVDQLLEYRQLAKLKSTYCDAFAGIADQNGRVHSTLNQTETRTGRISSAEPNLQNIPVKRPEGRKLRRFFTAQPGYVLCDADYSQIELRVLAAISGDAAMARAFNEGVDIHTLTASQVFDMPEVLVTPLMRSQAKAVNFGIVYGIGAFSLAKDIGVTRAEADSYIKGYMRTYPGVAAYMAEVVAKAKQDGYVSTLFGRRRLLPELSSSNGMLRSFGERVARNMPIQGTAADIIKIAMIQIDRRLEKELPAARLILQVHDELIVEAPAADAELAKRILKEEMENAVVLSVPFTVDVGCGTTWYDAKE